MAKEDFLDHAAVVSNISDKNELVSTVAALMDALSQSRAKVEFMKSKGLSVATMTEAGKEPYLAYVIEPGSELCDLETVKKLTDAETRADEALVALHAITDHFSAVMSGPIMSAAAKFENGVEGIPTIARARAVERKFWGIGDTAEELSRGYSVPPFSEVLASFRPATSKAAKIQFEQEDGTSLTITIQEAIDLAKMKAMPIGPGNRNLEGWLEEGRRAAMQCWTESPRELGGQLEIDGLREGIAQRFAGWMDTAARYARNADFWRDLNGKAVAELAVLRNKIAAEDVKNPNRFKVAGFLPDEIAGMFDSVDAVQCAIDYNDSAGSMASAMGYDESGKYHDQRVEFLKARIAELNALI